MTGFRRTDNALVWEMKHETVLIQPWGLHSLRVRATKAAEVLDLPNALWNEPVPVKPEITIEEGKASIRNGKLLARMNQLGILRFLDAETGEVLLEEGPQDFTRPPNRAFKPLDGDLNHIEVRFRACEEERIYGLGQHQHGLLDQKGCIIDLRQRNTEVAIPFLLSSRGYGFLWNNPAVGRVELGRNETRWVAEAARQIDYWITHSGSYAENLEQYVDVTGHPPMLPKWAAGFWQDRQRYGTQEELLKVAREYHARGLPLALIVADFFHWTSMGDFQWDPNCWPDPAAMVRELDRMGIKLMVSIWPSINVNSVDYDEMKRNGWLVRTERGNAALKLFIDTAPGRTYIEFYDATHPDARRFIWERIHENYYRHGIKTYWLDACEPEAIPDDHDHLRYHIGHGREVGCLYPLLHAQAFYEGLRSEGEDEIINLCRSAWAGSQRFGAAVWSGDVFSTFEALRAQVCAGLNIGLSGIPWWTTDIGGYQGGEIASPYFRELIVRWFQYGAFCPLFRLHGFRLPAVDIKNGSPNEVWSFGDEAYGILRELLFLRERMRPYLMKQMLLAHEHGTPPMRPLLFDFPGDATSHQIEDEFMFGPDILVAPVLEMGARQRRLYLPDGEWHDAWTGESLKGAQWIQADAALDRIPVYVRGSQIGLLMTS